MEADQHSGTLKWGLGHWGTAKHRIFCVLSGFRRDLEDLRSSGILRNVDWQFRTDISGEFL